MSDIKENILVDGVDSATTIITSVGDLSDEYFKRQLSASATSYDPENKQYSVYLKNDGSNQSITFDDIDDWGLNPQSSIDKVVKIGNYILQLVNTDGIIGRAVELISSNINTDVQLLYSHESEEGRNKKKKFSQLQNFIHEFNDSINLNNIIKTVPIQTYMTGNAVLYLRHEDPSNYHFDVYPFPVVEISDYNVNGVPVVMFNVDKLKSALSKTYEKTKSRKALFFENIDAEVKANYPAEVYEAFKNKEKYAILDYRYCIVVRINNFGKKYGVSPILRCLKDALTLENMQTSDNSVAKSKRKKIIHQKLRKELVADNPDKPNFEVMAYSHNNLLRAWKQDTCLVTTLPHVESIQYVEAKSEFSDTNTLNYYRSNILSTLGISFAMNNGSQGMSNASISVTQLMRVINNITGRLEDELFRIYRQVLLDSGFSVGDCPHIRIIDSELLEASLRKDLAQFAFNVLGASRETTFDMIGLNVTDEARKRKAESEKSFDVTFSPHQTSYTQSGGTSININDGNIGRPQSNNPDTENKQEYDQERNNN